MNEVVSHHLNRRFNRKTVFLLVVALLTLYIVVPRIGSFKDSLNTLRSADTAYILLGVGLWLATYFVATLVYKIISPRSLPYLPTLLVQVASGFTNRIVPAGTGAMAVNMKYLVTQGLSSINAGAIVALNNLLGFVGNMVLLILVLILDSAPLNIAYEYHVSPYVGALIIILVITVLGGLIFASRNRSKLGRILTKAVRVLKSIFRRPERLLFAWLMSMSVTTLYGVSLFAIGLAFNVHLTIVQTLVVLTAGVVAATITPTPGGLGGAEAGLVAVLVSVGITPQQALTVALTYRFITYWLPIVPGFICFQLALKKRYI